MSNEAFEEKIGTHSIRFQPPDLFLISYVGDLTPDVFVRQGKIFSEMTTKFYCIVHVGELGNFSTAAKKAIKEVPMASGLAVVGASRQMQLTLSVLNKVYMMVNFGKNSPITFVETEEAAQQWIDARRRIDQSK